MPRVRQTEQKIVRHRRRDGSVATYQYERPASRGAAKPAGSRPSADPLAFQRVVLAGGEVTLGDLVRAWRYSTHYAELATKTQANYLSVVRHPALGPLLGVACRDISPRSLRLLRDGIAEAGRARLGRPTKRMANLVLNVLGAAFAWGLENFDLERNPVIGLKRLRPDSAGHQPWSDATVSAWLERGPEWSRRLIQLGLWTALRASDLIALRWDAWDGQAIQITPQKTKNSSRMALYIPLSPAANATLAAWRGEAAVGITILTQSHGAPWGGSNYLALMMARTRTALDLPPVTVHGLRVTAATRLIEAGVSPRDVMALTGHTQDQAFAKYIRHADQRQRAERAAARWAEVTPLRPAAIERRVSR